jgi:hypothetical protein
MRKLLVVLAALPLTALAQAAAPGRPAGGPGRPPEPERLEKRMRLARTLGLAEALDLDTAQALKLDETLGRFDDRRKVIRKQAADARDALRRAAANDKATAAEVDAAVAKLLDARTQAQALDKETLQAVTQGLSPDRKARATLFLGQLRRMERRMMARDSEDGRGPGAGTMHGHGSGALPGAGGMAGPPYGDRGAGTGPYALDDDN